jgi:hypothetical protein
LLDIAVVGVCDTAPGRVARLCGRHDDIGINIRILETNTFEADIALAYACFIAIKTVGVGDRVCQCVFSSISLTPDTSDLDAA